MRQNKRLAALVLALLFLAPGRARAAHEDILKPVDPLLNSPRENLRLSLFGADAAKPGCKTAAAAVDKDLEVFVAKIIAAIKAKDDKSLQPLFHERTNTSLAAINDIYGRIELSFGKKPDVSVYRLFALNSVDGAPVTVPCDGGQESAAALYGYPLQFGLWLQILGQKELGRIYLLIVPAAGRWNIGFFYLHQWTNGGKDGEAWAKEAQKLATAGHKESAYVYDDVAIKLLASGNYLELPVRAEVEKARDALFKPEAWDKMIKAQLKDRKISYAGTMLVPDTGTAGILVRETVPGEVSVEWIENTCADMATTLAKNAWAADLSGIRCGFNLPREAPSAEGILGGMYMTFADAQKNVEKRAKTKK